ncbi:MAG: amino acid ABC transporter substrate-binding protein [Nocardioidaceae bacterium]|nr:amino acid ABC transporter substrate-binding protein [Nocardioidaceae bacterium]
MPPAVCPPRAVLLAALSALALAACAPADDETATRSEPTASSGGSAAPSDECAPDQLPLLEPGQLTIATDDPAYPPWFLRDDPTNGKGYESAVAYAVAQELGFSEDQVEWVTVPFNASYQPGPKDFDFDINQISITPQRADAVTFSRGYYSAAQAVITLADSPYADAASLGELADATIGAQVGTTSLAAVTDVIQPSRDPAVYDDTNAATKALENGQVDVIVADLPSAFFITAAVLDAGTIAGQFQPTTGETEQFGLLLEKGNPLVGCLDTTLDALERDGTLARLENRWLSDTVDVPELT